MTVFVFAQNYLSTNATSESDGSAFFFDNFDITDQTRIVVHIKPLTPYSTPNKYTFFGTKDYYLRANSKNQWVAKTEPNGTEHVLGVIDYDRECYIDFGSGRVTIDYSPNAIDHKYEATWSYSAFKKEKYSTRFDFGSGFNTGYDGYSNMTIYEINIYQGTKLQHHYIPSLFRGKKCLYDTKNDSFWMETNGSPHFITNITACNDHKYVMLDQNDDVKKGYGARCCICNTFVPIGQWSRKEELGVTAVDPYFDTEADSLHIGQQKLIVTSAYPMSRITLFNAETNSRDIICEAKGENTFTITLPQTDKMLKYNLVAQTMTTETFGTQVDSVPILAPVAFIQKPYHTLNNLVANEINVLDAQGNKQQENMKVTFNINNYKDEDIIESDGLLVMRAFKSDFSDAMNIGSLNIDDNNKGVFTFIDEDLNVDNSSPADSYTWLKSDLIEKVATGELSKYNGKLREFYTYPYKPVYYKVSRATAHSLWPNSQDNFRATTEEYQTSMLPPVSSITLTKEKDWEESKTVKLRIELANPYPWEYAEPNDKTIQEKLKKAILSADETAAYRKYRWDENAIIHIKRYSYEYEHYKGEDYAAKTITISGSEVSWDANKNCFYAEVEDVQSLPYLHYYYDAEIDGTSCIKCYSDVQPTIVSTSKDEADACWSEDAALIASLTADQGTSEGQICVKWELGAGEKSNLKLVRTTLNAEADDVRILDINQESDSYVDTDVAPGVVYEYHLTSTLEYRGSTYQSDKTCNGWVSFYGSISGKVILPDGTGLADARVRVTRERAVVIPTAKDKDGNVILEGVTGDAGFSVETTSDQSGYFHVDNLLYNADAATYVVSVEYGVCSFDGNGKVLSLSPSQCIYDNADFVCATSHKFVGRVLYENSTVPVKGVKFLMNGKEINDRNGKPIETDQEGNFTIVVPTSKITLQATKEGHTFLDAAIKDIQGNAEFTPTQDYSGLIIYDKTKVRVVGRIVGGDTEGSKPLGYGLSKNNLGDDMLMVLQLEGNNTAQIVYKKDNPDDTEINDTICHTYGGGATAVSFQKKRIIIKPDVNTGEFYVDLFPTKYKVTQLTAKGYSTLFATGEGFEVIDYTDSVNLNTETIEQNNKNLTLHYNAKYNRVYHNPVTLTYQQYRYGMKVNYFGEDKINEYNLLGTKYKAVIASTDNAGKVTYTFGYPVFKQGNKYTLMVRAHEDYYYNGDPRTLPQEVNINGGKLHVKNGLDSYEKNEDVYELDAQGTRTIVLDVNNTNFSLSGEDALRSLVMQVEINNFYYDAKPLKAYVLGSRVKGTDALASFNTEKGLIDVIRDPYGASSSAYRESGTTYHWDYDFLNSREHELTIKPGVGGGGTTSIGFGVMTETSFEAVVTGNIEIPLSATLDKKNGQYEMTLTERISTSSNPLDVGAMADVYLGYGTRTDVITQETISIIDEKTYTMVSEAIAKGAVKILVSGKDEQGYDYYVVIGDKLAFSRNVNEIFAYSQKHILGTLIPNLEKKRNALLLEGTEGDIQALADETGKVQYMILSKENNEHKMIIPKGREDDTFVDQVEEYNNEIAAWKNLVFSNEKAKVQAQTSNNVQRYSVSGTTIDHSEGATQYYIEKNNVNIPTAVSGGVTGEGGNGSISNADHKPQEYYIMAGGLVVKFSMSYQKTVSKSETKNYYKVESMGSGYTLSTNDNGYMDIDVYNVVADKAIMINGTLKEIDGRDVEVAKIHDYVYYVRGGALRNPWYAPDSTLFYNPGTPLGMQTLKIDNPRISVENPVVSNIPEDEKATFKITLTNDSEISDKSKYLNPSGFVLLVDDSTNPYSAKISIDGQALTSGREFYIAPGQSITKTLVVEHGTGYDYNNIKLLFRDAGVSLFSYATISVHYLPVATSVRLVAPEDKWVMNTLSASDDKGFYIPVKVDGFDVNSEGFHHIELQYKKRSEGESQYVNLCSFFSDSTLYATSNGDKRMIEGGKIENFKFYGEKDPIEMEYDLRAVSFRKLGTGLITRTSSVMTGKKDTRHPEVFGLPEPSSSILTYQDTPTLNFSEPIAYNYLDKTANFQVVGYTNETDILQSSTLHFPGTSEQLACTSLERNLSSRDFTIDMMIKKASGVNTPMSLFSHGDESDFINFYIDSDNSLNAVISGELFTSGPLTLDLSSALTHVGMAYDHSTGKVQFFANDSYISQQGISTPSIKYNNVGKVYLGTFLNGKQNTPFKGEMLEVRLWSKILSESEISAFKGKHLTGYERQLIANWPLTETIGNKAQDRVHGADLTLKGLTWNSVEGYSLHVDKRPICLDAMKLTTNKYQDNSIEFWFNVDKTDEAIASNQGGRIALFKAGDVHLGKGQGKMFIGFDHDDFIVNTNDSSFVIGKRQNYVSTGWHHFAMTVNRATNYMAVYLDSKLVCEDDATLVDGIASDYAALGDSAMVGNFDVFAQWEMALPSYYIKDFYNTTLFGTEMGLKNYLPFHCTTTNNQGTRVLDFSVNNEIVKKDVDGNIVTSKDTLVISAITDTNKDLFNHAPVKELPLLQNLDFSWTSTGNALQLNVNEYDSKINKQYIYFTVRGVEDLSGNTMKNPVMWACYVDKNVLRWKEQNIQLESHFKSSAQTYIEWRNVSGKRLDFKVDNLPEWLKIDRNRGTATAEKEGSFIITTDKDLAPGKYTETIYLTDENGLSDPLTIDLVVLADETGWAVDKTMYDRTMNIMAKVACNGYSSVGFKVKKEYYDDDPLDVVGAFINGECVGVANISNDPDFGAYLMMTIYGDSLIARSNPKKNITFLLWKHDTGVIYELENTLADGTIHPIPFITNSAVGLPPEEPVVLKITDKIEQDIYLSEGWNWVSFNVSPRAVDGINSVFINQAGLFSDDDIIKHVDFAQYSEKYKSWLGTLDKTDYHNVYQIFVKNPGMYKMLGYELPQDSLCITVQSGWNDLPYLLSESLDINRALADFQIGDKAKSGDIIKSLDEFAVAKEDPETGTGVWVGTLKYLTPGKGYYLKHNGQPTSFTYQKDALYHLPHVVSDTFSASSPNNMPVIATFAEDVDYHQGDRLLAFVNGTLVGEAEARDSIFFISVNADEGDVVMFAQQRKGEIIQQTPCGIKFNADAVVGSLQSPFKVSFNNPDINSVDIYDINGIKYSRPNSISNNSIYIINGKKVLSNSHSVSDNK